MRLNFFEDPFNTITACITISVCVLILSLTYGWISNHKANLMAKDIEMALDKGIDPMVIRCTYAEEDDRSCLVFATSRGAQLRDGIKITK